MASVCVRVGGGVALVGVCESGTLHLTRNCRPLTLKVRYAKVSQFRRFLQRLAFPVFSTRFLDRFFHL
jgi:hypothetical protein